MESDRSSRLVANWIFVGVGMLIVQVLLGGITRLTGSGLSITEWKPIMGALLPMDENSWQLAFTKYQQIAQYKYLNQHFTLSDFKFIFFWEWFHRLWARIIGIVFLIPFIYFIAKKHIKQWMILPLVILFLLGALQGAVGWLMVKSGLNDNDLYVSHIRLAAHFMAAMVLVAYAVVFGLQLRIPAGHRIQHSAVLRGAIILLMLVIIQLTFGAFMAGLKAAMAAPTWPQINGSYWSNSMLADGSVLHNIFYNKLMIHFIHRNLAYLIVAAVFVWWFQTKKIISSPSFSIARQLLLVLVILQVCLGISALLTSPYTIPGRFGSFEWLALMHQLFGMLLFLIVVSIIFIAGKRKLS